MMSGYNGIKQYRVALQQKQMKSQRIRIAAICLHVLIAMDFKISNERVVLFSKTHVFGRKYYFEKLVNSPRKVWNFHCKLCLIFIDRQYAANSNFCQLFYRLKMIIYSFEFLVGQASLSIASGFRRFSIFHRRCRGNWWSETLRQRKPQPQITGVCK